MQYISETWISSTVFPPKDWSVYGQTIRTNNWREEQIPLLPPDKVTERRSWAMCHASQVSVREEVATHPKEEMQETPGPSLRVGGTICKQSEDCYPAP